MGGRGEKDQPSLGALLSEARAHHGLSLQQVADEARCSAAYVHKLEADRVRSPSPRVLAALADALGLAYTDVMTAAGYDPPASGGDSPTRATAVKRFSNAHIVQLLEQLQKDVQQLRDQLTN